MLAGFAERAERERREAAGRRVERRRWIEERDAAAPARARAGGGAGGVGRYLCEEREAPALGEVLRRENGHVVVTGLGSRFLARDLDVGGRREASGHVWLRAVFHRRATRAERRAWVENRLAERRARRSARTATGAVRRRTGGRTGREAMSGR